jgi:hypothetical protein
MAWLIALAREPGQQGGWVFHDRLVLEEKPTFEKSPFLNAAK